MRGFFGGAPHMKGELTTERGANRDQEEDNNRKGEVTEIKGEITTKRGS